MYNSNLELKTLLWDDGIGYNCLGFRHICLLPPPFHCD